MRIIPTFDPREDRSTCFVASLEVISIQHLAFKSREDAFGHRVVEAVADATHRGSYTELRAARAEGDCGAAQAQLVVATKSPVTSYFQNLYSSAV